MGKTPFRILDGRMMQPARTSLLDSPARLHGPASRIPSVEVSVCIANWNCKDYLYACLLSLRDSAKEVAQEVIVVDNDSQDGAADMAVRDFPEVKLIRNQANLGFARASNQAAAVARGRYVFFLNNDTLVLPRTLRELIDYADEHPDVGMVGPRLRDGSGGLQISYRRKPTVVAMLHRTALLRWTQVFKLAYDGYRRKTFGSMETCEVEVLLGAAVLMPRELFHRVGRWDEDFRFGVEDVELSSRVGKKSKLIYLPSVEIVHHGRVGSRQNVTLSAPQLLIGYAHYFRKTGCSRAAIWAYKLVVTLDTPIQLSAKLMQVGWCRLRGKKSKARKSMLAVLGLWHFLRHELGRFWRT